MQERTLKTRIGDAIAALLLWVVLVVMALPALAFFPVLVLAYVIKGGVGRRDNVKDRGKALDQLVNAFYFDGNPKETISSHAGRWLFEKHGLPVVPWWVDVVARITDVFERDHVIKAIEAPFIGMPLR